MRTATLLMATAALAGSALIANSGDAQTNRRERFRVRGSTPNEEPTPVEATRLPPRTFTEAPAGFDSVTNGFLPQGPAFDTLDENTVVPLRSFNDNRFIFEEVETKEDGIGPVYNA